MLSEKLTSTPEGEAEEDREDSHELHRGSFSVEDNKLRLYPAYRFDELTLQRVKSAGFKWAPKQELFVAPAWTPDREDLLLELCGEIDDEDYSPEERAADRAERFEGYREKRLGEAVGGADRFEAGPSVFGHQNAARAERLANRHDRLRLRSLSQWSKAEYWQQRTAGVIRHALFKSSAPVRRGRLLRLEKEQRKHLQHVAEAQRRWEIWTKIAVEPDAQVAHAAALRMSNHSWSNYTHPRTGREGHLDTLLRDEQDPLTGAEAAQLVLAKFSEGGPAAEGTDLDRWTKHYELRIQYEQALLDQEGGMAADVDMEAGGWFGGQQIQKVHRSPVTKRVVSIDVLGPSRGRQAEPGKLYLHKINVERFGEAAYQPPTEDERLRFLSDQDQQKAEAKAARGKPISLINPTEEDAQKLQDLWNEQARKRAEANGSRHVPAEIVKTTQAKYSAATKHNSYCETVTIGEHGTDMESRHPVSRQSIFKVRKASNGQSFCGADRVVVLTDKPQKPLPWEAMQAARASMPTTETVRLTLGELGRILYRAWSPSDLDPQERQLLNDAIYVGWAYSRSSSQRGLTDEGKLAMERFRAENPDYFRKAAEPKVELVTA